MKLVRPLVALALAGALISLVQAPVLHSADVTNLSLVADEGPTPDSTPGAQPEPTRGERTSPGSPTKEVQIGTVAGQPQR